MTRAYGFRDANGNLVLDAILGPEGVRHYTRILESASPEFAERQRMMRELPGPAWDDPAPAPWRAERVDDGLVRMRTYLPAVASSCTDLEPLPSFCWDVCGYYRRLGVHWKATLRELRLAYNTVDPRQSDERVAYAFSQLWDPQVRRLYDLMPLGGVFLLDRDVTESIKRAAAREAARRMSHGEDGGAQADVLREWGMDEVSPEESRERAVAASLPPALRPRSWGTSWGYYALVRADTDWAEMPDSEEMGEWQAMIAGALARRGIKIMFAVGAHDGESPLVLRDSNQACIFVTGKGISPKKAEEAVRMGISLAHIRIREE
jgi:hypothetical protein